MDLEAGSHPRSPSTRNILSGTLRYAVTVGGYFPVYLRFSMQHNMKRLNLLNLLTYQLLGKQVRSRSTLICVRFLHQPQNAPLGYVAVASLSQSALFRETLGQAALFREVT